MFTPSRRFVHPLHLALAAGLPVLALLALAPGAQGQTDPDAPVVAQLRAQIADGTFLRHHGRHTLCDTCDADVVTTGPGSTAVLSTSTPVGLGARDLEKAYSLPAAAVGRNGTVAIITAGAYPSLESDLAVYRHQYGLPACTTTSGCLTVTDYHGGPPLAPSDDPEFMAGEEFQAVETALDVDMASAACPSCHIVVVQAPEIDATGDFDSEEALATDYATAYQTAVRSGADTASLSALLGFDAADPSDGLDAPFNKALDQPGAPLFASIGDVAEDGPESPADRPADTAQTGRGGEGNGISHFYNWPSDLPWAVAVGGTTLAPDAASPTGFSETGWLDLGGSCAMGLPPALGQPAYIAAGCGGHRASSDVSAVADSPSGGVAVHDTYTPSTGTPQNWIVSGGTSASTPFVAAWYARGHGRTAHAAGPQALYGAPASDFNDITIGTGDPDVCQAQGWSQTVCKPGPGWDGTTGLGTPRGIATF